MRIPPGRVRGSALVVQTARVCGLWHYVVFPETEPGNHLSHGPQIDDLERPGMLGCPGKRSAVISRLLKLDDLSPDLPDLAQ